MKKLGWVFALVCVVLWASSARGTNHSDVSVPNAIEYLGCRLGLVTHVTLHQPKGEPVGDVLYLHGLGDAADNHRPLFQQFKRSGLRVIAVDLPSHGLTSGASINFATFSELGRVVVDILNSPIRADNQRPLILAGWSTGGLILVRMLQMGMLKANHYPSGMVLFAPGISVRALPGNWGRITEGTLTRNPHPPHRSVISPASPFAVLPFALRLKVNSWLAQSGNLPKDVPTLVFLGSDVQDRYVHTPRVRSWFESQIDRGADVWVYQFEDAYHELDNELEPIADRVQSLAALFSGVVAFGSQPVGLLGRHRIRRFHD